MQKAMTKTVTIANGASESDAIRVDKYAISGLILPAAFDGTAITFLASDTFGGTYVDVYDSDNNQVSATVAASRAIGLSGAEADALAPWSFIKIKSNAAETAARSVKLALK